MTLSGALTSQVYLRAPVTPYPVDTTDGRAGALQWQNFEAWPEQGETCYVESAKKIPCNLGRISPYSVQAESVADVQAAVKFARFHNLKVAIRNTGHDFGGRSSAPHSLQISTHRLQGLNYEHNFVPEGAKSRRKGEGRAVTISAGVQLYQLYSWLNERDIMVVCGTATTVGVAGGYMAGGGHSLLGPLKGMASDNALEFTVVTADVSRTSSRSLATSVRVF